MIDRELEELRRRAEAAPAEIGLWRELLAASDRAGNLEDGVERVRRCLSLAGGGERLERAFLQESFRAGFGLGDPLLQVKSGLVQVELAPDGRHLALGTGRHGAVLLETTHWSVRTRIPAAAPFHLVDFSGDGKALCLGLVETREPDPGHRIRLVFWEDGEPPVLRSYGTGLPKILDLRLLGASEDWRHFRVTGAGDLVGMLELADWRDPGSSLQALGFHRLGPYLPHDRIAPENLPPKLRVVMPDGWLEANPPRPPLPGARDPGRPEWEPGGTVVVLAAPAGSPPPGGKPALPGLVAAPAVHSRPLRRLAFGDAGRILLSEDAGGSAVLWSMAEGVPFLRLDPGPFGRILELAAGAPLALVQRGIRWELFETATRVARAGGPAYDAAGDPWSAAALAPDGTAIAFGTAGGSVGLVRAGQAGDPLRTAAARGPVAACGFLPGDAGLWSLGLADGLVSFHAPDDLRITWTSELPRDRAMAARPCVLPRPDATELVLGLVGTPLLVGPDRPRPQPLFGRPQGTGIHALSPDGAELASAHGPDGLTLWDMPRPGTRRKAWCREGRLDGIGPVAALAYSPDGRWLVYAQACHMRLMARSVPAKAGDP